MKISATIRTHPRERGYILIAILFAVTIAIIALAAAVPAIRTRIKRDREEELIHRAHQYTRGIQLYYRKFGRYPASIEQLENTNNIRFIRQKYKDPITGKDEWKLLHFGQVAAKPRPAYLKGATPAGGAAGAGGGQGQGGSGQGSQGQLSTTGAGTAGPGSGISNASDISKSLSGSSTFGGGPIVGIASTSDKEGLKEIDGKTKYNEWEFVYDPTLDPNGRAGGQPQGGVPGQGAPIPGTPGAPGFGTVGDRPSRPPR